MTGVTSALVAELEGAANNGTSERRVQMLWKVTDLFLSEAARLTEPHIGIFDDVLVRLMERIEAQALVQFSVSISDSTVAPIGVIRRLAYHEDGSIAAPALSKSNRLSESDLVEIAGTRGQQHLRAISGRKTLGETVTDVLLKRGDYDVSRALARNAGARFSDYGYATLVEKSERDDGLAEATGLRSDIPAKALRLLLMNASEAVRSRLLKAARPEMRKRIQASLQQIGEQISDATPKRIDYTAAEKAVELLNRTGKLNDSALSRFAIRGEYPSIVAALSRLSAVTIETVESLVLGGDSDGLIVACRAARLDWSTALSIINNRPDCLPVSQQKLEQGKEIFEALSLSAAQQTIRIWSSRSSAKKADVPSTRHRRGAAGS
jgi:uncharacterized protein (DUF2336 family)